MNEKASLGVPSLNQFVSTHFPEQLSSDGKEKHKKVTTSIL